MSVEPLRFNTRQEREERVAAAGYNLFGLHARDIPIDPLNLWANHRIGKLRK